MVLRMSLLRHEEWWKNSDFFSLQAKSFEYHGKKSWILPWWKCKTEVAPHFHTVPKQDFMSKTFCTLEAIPSLIPQMASIGFKLVKLRLISGQTRTFSTVCYFLLHYNTQLVLWKSKSFGHDILTQHWFFQWSHTVKSESKWLSNAYIID